MKRLIVFLSLLCAASGIFWWLRSAPSSSVSAEIVALQSSEDTSGFARADRKRAFTFPADHGPHPEFQTEWWYYTGNLDTSDGRHFGYQLTFFRRAIAPVAPSRTSDWATNQIYFAHFAITDVKANDHFSTERFSRGAAGLAGATGEPYRIWLEDWEFASLSPDAGRVQLRAADAGRALALTLEAEKPPTLHGDEGLSQKSNAVGNASYYVSFTRLKSEGTISVNGQTFTVRGLSWMDHEFGTTGLGPDAVGWDWFSIQLNDKREVMFFQIRQKDGSIEPLSSGTLIQPDGSTQHLTKEQVNVQVLDHWTSSQSGATYPARWTLTIPSANIALTLKPYIADQEMHVSFTYWEGAVAITGMSAGAAVTGNGYVELTGYATSAQAQLPR